MSDDFCSCHINPPCSFCTDMTEAEVDIFNSEGVDGVLKYRRNREYESGEATGEGAEAVAQPDPPAGPTGEVLCSGAERVAEPPNQAP